MTERPATEGATGQRPMYERVPPVIDEIAAVVAEATSEASPAAARGLNCGVDVGVMCGDERFLGAPRCFNTSFTASSRAMSSRFARPPARAKLGQTRGGLLACLLNSCADRMRTTDGGGAPP